jgi:hypothetical protein
MSSTLKNQLHRLARSVIALENFGDSLTRGQYQDVEKQDILAEIKEIAKSL